MVTPRAILLLKVLPDLGWAMVQVTILLFEQAGVRKNERRRKRHAWWGIPLERTRPSSREALIFKHVNSALQSSGTSPTPEAGHVLKCLVELGPRS